MSMCDCQKKRNKTIPATTPAALDTLVLACFFLPTFLVFTFLESECKRHVHTEKNGARSMRTRKDRHLKMRQRIYNVCKEERTHI